MHPMEQHENDGEKPKDVHRASPHMYSAVCSVCVQVDDDVARLLHPRKHHEVQVPLLVALLEGPLPCDVFYLGMCLELWRPYDTGAQDRTE